MIRTKIPTIVGLFILLTALVATLFAIRQLQLFKSDASTNFLPRDIKITNIGDTSFSVSWITDGPSIGFVEYQSGITGPTNSSPTTNSKTHLVTLTNLNPATLYTFKINSNGELFTKNNSSWSAQTLSIKIFDNSKIVSGQILNENGFPIKDALVFVEISEGTFATQVSNSGNWIMTLPDVLDTTLLQILVQASTSSVALAKVDMAGANPVPPIKIGNSYDFRNQLKHSKSDIPRVDFNLP